MSEPGENFYPPPDQTGTTEVNIPATFELNPAQQEGIATGNQQNVPPGQPQYMLSNQLQFQYTQQQYNPQNIPPQQQYVPQMSPQQQQYNPQKSHPQQQYVPQMRPQQQYVPQQFYPKPGQQFQSPVQPLQGQSPYPYLTTPLQPWTTQLFDCAQDMDNCLITAFFPCITFGQIAEITDQGASSCSGAGLIYGLLLYTGFHWVYSWMYRTRLRATYNLMEDPFHDCLVHFLCDPCALCQEYRELKNRGFNMQLGWIGNMQLQQQQAAAGVPPPVQGMTR